MIFEKIQLKNFQSCKDISFDFKQGIIGISGNNGSGKSTIFRDGIMHSLYGSCLRSKTPEEYVQQGNESLGFALCLDLTIEGKIYRIIRKFVKGKREVEFYINGIKENSLKSDIQSYLNEIIGLDEKLFNYITLISPESKNLLELTKSEREDFFYRLLSLDKFKKLEKSAKQKKSELIKRCIELETLLAKNNKRYVEIESEQVLLILEYNNYKKIIDQQDAILQASEKIELKNFLNKQIKEKQIKAQNAVNILNKTQRIFNFDLITAKTKLENCKNKIFEQQNQIQEATKYLNKYSSLLNQNIDGKCPTCEQDLNKQQLNILIQNYQNQIQNTQKQLDQFKTLAIELNAYKEKISLELELELLKNQIIEIETSNSIYSLNDLISAKSKLEKIELLKAEVDKMMQEDFILKKELELKTKQLQTCDKVLNFAEQTPDILIEKVFSDILNLTNTLIHIELQSEKCFQQYQSCSTGEKFRINLALRIALNKMLSSIFKKATIETLIIDEGGIGTLDPDISTLILETLKELVEHKTLKQVILITHKPELLNYCENSYKIEKINNTTSISIL